MATLEKGMKKCRSCGESKPHREFNMNRRNKSDGRQGKCKPCEREYSADWHARNREKERDRCRQWRSRNHDHVLAVAAKRRVSHPHEKWESNYRIRMRKHGHKPVVASFTKEQLVERYGAECVYCGGNFESIDHVTPLSKGGHHTIENVRPSCIPCNRRKSTQSGFDS